MSFITQNFPVLIGLAMSSLAGLVLLVSCANTVYAQTEYHERKQRAEKLRQEALRKSREPMEVGQAGASDAEPIQAG